MHSSHVIKSLPRPKLGRCYTDGEYIVIPYDVFVREFGSLWSSSSPSASSTSLVEPQQEQKQEAYDEQHYHHYSYLHDPNTAHHDVKQQEFHQQQQQQQKWTEAIPYQCEFYVEQQQPADNNTVHGTKFYQQQHPLQHHNSVTIPFTGGANDEKHLDRPMDINSISSHNVFVHSSATNEMLYNNSCNSRPDHSICSWTNSCEKLQNNINSLSPTMTRAADNFPASKSSAAALEATNTVDLTKDLIKFDNRAGDVNCRSTNETNRISWTRMKNNDKRGNDDDDEDRQHVPGEQAFFDRNRNQNRNSYGGGTSSEATTVIVTNEVGHVAENETEQEIRRIFRELNETMKDRGPRRGAPQMTKQNVAASIPAMDEVIDDLICFAKQFEQPACVVVSKASSAAASTTNTAGIQSVTTNVTNTPAVITSGPGSGCSCATHCWNNKKLTTINDVSCTTTTSGRPGRRQIDSSVGDASMTTIYNDEKCDTVKLTSKVNIPCLSTVHDNDDGGGTGTGTEQMTNVIDGVKSTDKTDKEKLFYINNTTGLAIIVPIVVSITN